MNNEQLRADIQTALNGVPGNSYLGELLSRAYAALGEQQTHDVACVPTFPCECCGTFHSYSEVADAGGYCPQCDADYDERKMFADLVTRYTARAAAPKPVAQQKVVMPERMKPRRMLEDRYAEGWNACIEEIERLNGGKHE